MLKSSVPSYFEKRRKKLMRLYPDSTFVLPSSIEQIRNPDVHYPFRQETNLYYLSGFEEPESALVLTPSKKSGFESILFVRERDRHLELWTGERYGVERAGKVFGVDKVYPIKEFSKRLPEHFNHCKRVFAHLGPSNPANDLILEALEKSRVIRGRTGQGILPVYDITEPLGEMRLFKSPEEIQIHRKASDISAEAHCEAMRLAKGGMHEFEIAALVEYHFHRNQCRTGYGSIVAAGKNACCLHYTSNNDRLKAGEFLLIDAGAENDYYTADITRTFPVGRSFSKKQAEIYDLVLKAQKKAVKMAVPGNDYQKIQNTVIETFVEGLLQLGILKGKKKTLIETKDYRRVYPHSLGHWLGMDVHDSGFYQKSGKPRKFEPGMVLTIEPGLYFQTYDKKVPSAYKGLGVRIEDDVFITKKGNEVLTSKVPKEREEIEALTTSS